VRYIGNAVPFPLGAPPWTDYVNSHATEYRLAPNGSAVSVNRIARPVRFLGGSLTTHGGCNLIWNRTVSGGIGFQGHGVTQLPGGQGWLLLAGACIGNVSRPDGPLRGADALSLVSFRSTDDGWTWRYTATVADIEEYSWSYYGPGGGENALAVLADRKTVIAVARWDGNGGCDTIIPDGSPQDPHDGHGPTTISHYANYYESYSRDSGHTWTPMRKLPAMGCVRPRLLMLSPAGPLVLSGGRACNRPKSVGDRGVLLWVNADGMAGVSPPSLSDDGTDATAGVAAFHIRGMQNALIDCMTNYAKEPARRLVEALGPGNLPRSVNPDRHGMAAAGNVCFLALHVMRLGESAGARERSTHGPEFVQFVNQQIEKDFTAVLDAMEWTTYEKEEALQLCAPSARNNGLLCAHRPGVKSVLVTKDGRGDPPTAAPGYNRAICARVLMARGVVPPEDCPYLQCIAANIFRPGELGAQAARERFEGALAGKRPRSP